MIVAYKIVPDEIDEIKVNIIGLLLSLYCSDVYIFTYDFHKCAFCACLPTGNTGGLV